MACVTKFGADTLDKWDERALSDLLRISVTKSSDSKQFLQHNAFARLLGMVKMPETYAFDNPECEVSLANAKLYQESLGWLCGDASDIFRSGVPGTPDARHKEMERQLHEAAKALGTTPASLLPAALGGRFQVNMEEFKRRGLHEKDAAGALWALSFYTGECAATAVTNQAAGQVLRNAPPKTSQALRGNAEASKMAFNERYGLINYYLMEAMRTIPYYWGEANRMVNLDEETVSSLYRQGRIVEWMQWSSAKRGHNPASHWKGKSAKFRIWSVTGRHIEKYSNFSTTYDKVDEDEVLFAPLTRFIVLNVDEQKGRTPRWVVDLREVELGLFASMPLLWVDDRALEPTYENKLHMEHAQLSSRFEVKFIAKTSTAAAMAFLSFRSGCCEAKENSRMRILTDMTRPAEPEGDSAGARLAKMVEEQRRWDSCPFMIFCFDTASAMKKLGASGVKRAACVASSRGEAASALKQQAIIVTSSSSICREFCSFGSFE